jgi:copper transport protein
MWALFGVLLFAGLADLSLYAVRVSGEPFGFALFREALFETRSGLLWLVRIGLGFAVAVVISRAAREGRPAYWWTATGLGLVLLATLTLQSHAAAVGGALPLLSNWLHVVAAAFWMGGLVGFPLLLLGPLRKASDGGRTLLRRMAVRRFSVVATVAVMVIVVTGIHATLLNVPDAAALVGTSYGRALIMKLGLFVLLLAAGGINFVDRGRGLFGRMVGAELVLAVGIFLAAGFLTSLPPAGAP